MAGSENGIVIVSAARTPVGSFNGSLASVPASYLGTVALKAAMDRAKVAAADIDEAMRAFNPFAAAMVPPGFAPPGQKVAAPQEPAGKDDLQALKDQLSAMQQKLDTIAKQ